VPRRLARGVAELERRGFRVRLAEHVERPAGRKGKLADLRALFEDDEVAAIVCTTGGTDSHQLLDELDYALVAAHPKIFCGYSDITALQAAFNVRTGLVTFMGPSVLSDWAEFGGIPAYTWAEWEATVMRPEPRGEIGVAPEWSSEFTQWDQADDRPRGWVPNPGPRTVRAGGAEGPLVPANLSTLLLLAGTPWWPDLSGAVLALEAAEEEQVWWVERSLHQLRQMGVWERAAGVAFGRCHPQSGIEPGELDRLLLEATGGTTLPIAADFDFGHTEPHCTLPWGVQARLDADLPSISLLDAAVI
jgi:muramoyltetrapeptide carboxypeptidase LdcA involved in peptidoglycan recycling